MRKPNKLSMLKLGAVLIASIISGAQNYSFGISTGISNNSLQKSKVEQTQSFISRNALTINDNWQFKTDQDHAFYPINIPHTWNSKDATNPDGSEYYRGLGRYRKTIVVNKVPDQKYFLYFEGVNQTASLLINKDTVGVHAGGYTSFAFDVSKYVKDGTNEIELLVSNLQDDNLLPLSMDFTFYGGIYRDVRLITTNAVHFDILNLGGNGITIKTPVVSEQIGTVNIASRILNETTTDKKLEVTHTIFNEKGVFVKSFARRITLKSNSDLNEISINGEIKSPELWSPDNPALYTVVSEIKNLQTGHIEDQVVNTIGFRWFKMDPEKGFFLNGKHLKLVGVGKHQDYEGYGSAVPNALLIKDVETIKKMGANCYRTSHYPPDPEIIAACDRLGILVIEEIPLVNSITETKKFADNCSMMLSEMITRDMNHPSIFSWGISNEICILSKGKAGTDRGKEYDNHLNILITKLNDLAKSLDPDRLTTNCIHYKTERYQSSGVIRTGDFIGTNLYLGWYLGVPDSLVAYAKDIQKQTGGKPIVISEYGAGADPRLRSDNPRKFDFSLEYQTLCHKIWYKDIINNDFVSGSFVWNFADFSSPNRGDTNPLINNKGLVSYNRIPKDVFYFYQAALSKNPVINIGMKNWSYHAGIENNLGSCSKKIEVFTNTKEAELAINGKSFGRKKVSDFSVDWTVPMTDGRNLIEVTGFSSTGEMVKDYHSLDFQLIPTNLKQLKTGETIRINAGSSNYFLDEQEKGVWIPDRDYTPGSFGFIGGVPLASQNKNIEYREGVSVNIKGTEKDPIFQTQRLAAKEFKADVPLGQYEVTLCVADLSVDPKSSVYELRSGEDNNKTNNTGVVNFDILVNGKEIIKNLCPKAITGELHAYEFSFPIFTENGLDIKFVANNGGIVGVNAIKLTKIK